MVALAAAATMLFLLLLLLQVSFNPRRGFQARAVALRLLPRLLCQYIYINYSHGGQAGRPTGWLLAEAKCGRREPSLSANKLLEATERRGSLRNCASSERRSRLVMAHKCRPGKLVAARGEATDKAASRAPLS